MPGMTAETIIYVVEKKELLVVPSKALRFTPDQKLLSSYMGNQPKPKIPEETGNAKMGSYASQTGYDTGSE